MRYVKFFLLNKHKHMLLFQETYEEESCTLQIILHSSEGDHYVKIYQQFR